MQTYGECSKCRAAVPPSAQRCPVCGAGNPVANPAHHGRPGPKIPVVPNARRKTKKSNAGIIAIIVVAVLGLAGGAFALTQIFELSSDDDGDGKTSKKKKKKKGGDKDVDNEQEPDPEKPARSGEVAIPSSAAQHRIDPRGLSRGSEPQLKDSAQDVDLSSAMTFDPKTNPYCQNLSHFADLIKDVGYNIDRELRSTAAMTDAEEERIGDELFKEVLETRSFIGKIDRPEMAEWRRYISELAAPLLISAERKGIVYDFHTVSDMNVNAFAIPGGHIFFHRGVLESPRRLENEAQLAGVLAHEINHVDRRHTIAIFEYLRRLGGAGDKLGPQVVSMARHSFSSAQEDEADAYAVKFLIKAEYSPSQVVRQWQTWDALDTRRKKPDSDPLSSELEELMNTHSHPARRACNAMKLTMDGKSAHDRYYIGRSNYQQKKVRARQQF